MGKVAEKNPGLIREIKAAGHEIGLHTNEHLFPIFDPSLAVVVARTYDTSAEYVWKMSKTTQAFQRSLKSNREAITQAVGNVNISIFRSPCLVPSWGGSPEYFITLKQSGIMVDSSVIQDFSSTSSLPWPILPGRYGIIEVPVTRGDDILESDPRGIIRKMQGAGLPVVFFLHPKKFDKHDIELLDALLSEIESEYETVYLTIGDIANTNIPVNE